MLLPLHYCACCPVYCAMQGPGRSQVVYEVPDGFPLPGEVEESSWPPVFDSKEPPVALTALEPRAPVAFVSDPEDLSQSDPSNLIFLQFPPSLSLSELLATAAAAASTGNATAGAGPSTAAGTAGGGGAGAGAGGGGPSATPVVKEEAVVTAGEGEGGADGEGEVPESFFGLANGPIGTVQVHASGKMSLVIGEHRLLLTPTVPCLHAQYAVGLDPGGSTLYQLGRVPDRLMVEVDLDASVRKQAVC